MGKRRVISIALGTLALLLAVGWGSSFAQGRGEMYFPETGHSVRGEFLAFYEQASDPALIYGYPITGELIDPISGRTVQFFTRARFELYPENPEGARVQLSPLGDYIYDPTRSRPLDRPPAPSACLSFPNTVHQVCYTFRDFFVLHGGVEQFGLPLTDFVWEDDRIVQYFLNARFVWDPDRPFGHKVRLSDLGRIYFYESDQDTRELLQDREGNIPRTVLDLKVRAFTDRALASEGDLLTVFVIVQDQNLQPVRRADVSFDILWPSGEVESYLMPETDDNGIARLPIRVLSRAIGSAEIQVTVESSDLIEATRTSFRVWW